MKCIYYDVIIIILYDLLEYCSLLFLLDLFILFYVYGCPVQMWVCAPCTGPGVQRPNEGVRSVMDGCESSCECWEWNPGLLQNGQCSYPLSNPSSPSRTFFMKSLGRQQFLPAVNRSSSRLVGGIQC